MITRKQMKKLQNLAKELLVLNDERDELYEEEDYEGAFEIECLQRDISLEIATIILKGN